MMQRPRRSIANSRDCTCAECVSAGRMSRMIVLGTAAFWLLAITALLHLLA